MARIWQNKSLWLALMVVKVAAVAGYAYSEGWWSGWLGAKPKPAAVAPMMPAATKLDPLPTRAAALQLQPNDRVLGQFGAPLTIIEYASMTCSHCAEFNAQTMPQVKREWVETGKAVYVLRDLPWDNLALGLSAITRCVPPTQFYAMTDALFAAQQKMIQGDPMSTIYGVAAQAGLSQADVRACIGNAAQQQEILRSKEIARQVLGVKGTPALFINGTMVAGALKYDELKKTLEAEYAKAVAAKTP
jgi:protein-disulfide isomerase